MTLVNLGPAYWRFLHYFASNEVGVQLLADLKDLLPCQEWKDRWIERQESETVLEWTLRMHNSINTAIGKYDNWDQKDLEIAHPKECDICRHKEHIHHFPWSFLHNIAKQDGEQALAFLNEVNELYPCETCKRQLLLEASPSDGETLLQWTQRNHHRFCQERGIEEDVCCVHEGSTVLATPPLPEPEVVSTEEANSENTTDVNEAIFAPSA